MQTPLSKSKLANHTMKIVSVILIMAYLMLPAICFGHPCEMFSPDSQHCTIAPDASGECSFVYDTDNCETACCCAGHLPLSAFTEIPYDYLTASLLPYEPQLALSRVTDRIFIPPQIFS
jgi:hypothetical protein